MIDFNKAEKILDAFEPNMKKIIYYDILLLCDGQKLNLKKKLFKWLFTFNFSQLANSLNNDKLIVTFPYERKDHKISLDTILSDIDHELINDFSPKFKLNLIVVIKHFFESFYLLFKLNVKLKEFVYIWSNYMFYQNSIHEFNTLNFEKSKEYKYLAFSSSIGIEALICMCLKNKENVTSYSLTHGQNYINYNYYKPIDIINAINICSDFKFVWGETQRIDLNKNYFFPLKKILIGGNPKYKKQDVFKSNTCIGLVLLPRNANYVTNKYLLDLLKKMNWDFIIKLHPSSKINDYNEYLDFFKFTTTKEIRNVVLEEKISFAISYNSAVYFELISFGIPCYRYGKYENEIFSGLQDKFNSKDELASLLNSSHVFFENNKKEINLILKNNLGLGINNYKNILHVR